MHTKTSADGIEHLNSCVHPHLQIKRNKTHRYSKAKRKTVLYLSIFEPRKLRFQVILDPF